MSHGRVRIRTPPCSLIRAMGQMMARIGCADRKSTPEKAPDICTVTERRVVVTTQKEVSAAEFTDHLPETIQKPEK